MCLWPTIDDLGLALLGVSADPSNGKELPQSNADDARGPAGSSDPAEKREPVHQWIDTFIQSSKKNDLIQE